jgi:hypothetical protein
MEPVGPEEVTAELPEEKPAVESRMQRVQRADLVVEEP